MYKKKLIPKIIPNTKYVQEIDIPLLLNLFDFQTPNGDKKKQTEYFNYIIDIFIDKYNIDCIIDTDSYGNFYITKGAADFYPCIVNHLDQINTYGDFKTYHCGDFIIGLSNGEQCGMGADPKAGLYILLQLLLKFDNIKCVLFKEEESGCEGSAQANMDFFKDCSYVMQFDRRSFTTDVIEHTNGIQVLSEDFKKLLQPIMNNYNYSFNYGTCTDVGMLSQNSVNINTMNLSNGSFLEHCKNEVCSISHLLNALNFGIEILNSIENKQYVFEKEKYNYQSFKNFYKTNKIYEDWAYEDHFDTTGNLKEVVGINEGLFKEATSEEVEWLNEQNCPECYMINTLSQASESDIYCNYCGINYFIPKNLRPKKNNKHHSFSETW